MKRIHFVCTGNVYRSRIAESYLNSLEIAGIEVTSSGIEAKANCDGPITWYAMRVIKRRGLVKYMKGHWHQTNRETLLKQDYIIFMEKKHLIYAQIICGYSGKNYEVWEVPDMNENLDTYGEGEKELKYTQSIVEISEKTANMITEKTDNFHHRLKRLVG